MGRYPPTCLPPPGGTATWYPPPFPLQNPCTPLKLPPDASPQGMDVGSVLAKVFVGMVEAIVGAWATYLESQVEGHAAGRLAHMHGIMRPQCINHAHATINQTEAAHTLDAPSPAVLLAQTS